MFFLLTRDATDIWCCWCVIVLPCDTSDMWFFSHMWCYWHLMRLTCDTSDIWCYQLVIFSDIWCCQYVIVLSSDTSDTWCYWHAMLLTCEGYIGFAWFADNLNIVYYFRLRLMRSTPLLDVCLLLYKQCQMASKLLTLYSSSFPCDPVKPRT